MGRTSQEWRPGRLGWMPWHARQWKDPSRAGAPSASTRRGERGGSHMPVADSLNGPAGDAGSARTARRVSTTAFVDARAPVQAESGLALGRHFGGKRGRRARQRRAEMCGAMQ
jgi:hypothetical protein